MNPIEIDRNSEKETFLSEAVSKSVPMLLKGKSKRLLDRSTAYYSTVLVPFLFLMTVFNKTGQEIIG